VIVDAQLHEPPVMLDWEDADEGTRRLLLLELQLALMDSAGVGRAILFPVDREWGLFAAAREPERFGVVPMVTDRGTFGGISTQDPELERVLAELAAAPGVVGIRIVHVVPSRKRPFTVVPLEHFDRAVAAASRAGLPVFMSTAGELSSPARVARAHPELTVVVDHLGLLQPPSYPCESPPFRSLDRLLALADRPNIAVKVTGVPTLSERGYPFADLWPHLHRVVDAFGVDRLMWGSDISRVRGRIGFARRIETVERGLRPYPGKHTYAEALLYLRETHELSAAEKDALLGGTALRLLPWP
jgi:predicted TIM-barrel fold metal-dependent hydrolase